MDSPAFMSGVCCGAMFGAAVMMLIVSLIFENSRRKQERQLELVRGVWREPVAK